MSNKRVAERLGKHPSSIGRELNRNWAGAVNHYVAITAQAKADHRSQAARIRHPLKSSPVYAYVIEKLRWGWSPEQISGRLKSIDHPEQPDWQICPETIYQYIYGDHAQKKFADSPLWEYLPRKQKRRRKQTGRAVHKSHIPDRVSIHYRPEVANHRRQIGHWEGDTVEGRRSDKDGIHTEADRLSRLLAARKVDAISSHDSLKAQMDIFQALPPSVRKSTTLDNGRECHLHFKLKALGMATFFADPYSSWQRGTNEYHNGLLRRYLPKGTSFRNLTQPELDEIVWEINQRPRKCLGYNTPQEVFDRELAKLGVAIPVRM